ncbi:MAG: hypothetical protein QM729_07400 [Solirubrobacterales bacterium]
MSTEISVDTDSERFACRMNFGDGLTLIRAANNMGKTTLLTAILYSLGWEGMLGPSRTPPFKPSATNEIADPKGVRHGVLGSTVNAELEGDLGAAITVERAIKSETQKSELVRTWRGRAMTDPGDTPKAGDYYAREGGAATHEAGYQAFLADFIGWTMPMVSRWQGDPVPLYMEVIAPFLFVEQTRGWSRIAATVPRYLQIRDPERRAVEFLLSLDSLTRSRERDALIGQREEERAGWKAEVGAFSIRAGERGARVSSLPENATPSWPPSVPIAIELLENDQWRTLDSVLSDLRRQAAAATGEVPTAQDAEPQVTEELTTAESNFSELSGLVASANRDAREQSGELEELNVRIQALEEDRTRYTDAIKLRQLGSQENLEIDNGHCPTCEQLLPPSLQVAGLSTALTLEENKSLIEEELKTFKAVRDDAAAVLSASRQRQSALHGALTEERRRIRTLKGSLTQSPQAPSQAEVARRIRLLDRIEALEELDSSLLSLEASLEKRSKNYRAVLADLAEIGDRGSATNADSEKLAAFENLFREQLDEYGFSSVPALDVELARDSYMPLYKERPLKEEKISASDNVRLVWAYVVGLLEMARNYEIAHPGLLILDEPGQQEIEPGSLEALLHRLARSSTYEQQVIVASSKKPDVVRSILEGTDATLNEVDGYILKPPSSAPDS